MPVQINERYRSGNDLFGLFCKINDPAASGEELDPKEIKKGMRKTRTASRSLYARQKNASHALKFLRG
jgi:hypothetical protein